MAVMTPRESWTDPRLDEFAKRVDERFDDLSNRMDEGFRAARVDTGALRAETGSLRAETGSLRTETIEVRKEIGEVREGLGEVKAEIKGINRTLQVGFGLIGAVLTGILGLIAAQLATQL